MLTLSTTDRDGVSRRDFLTLATLGLGGLALHGPRLSAQAVSSARASHKAVIQIFLPGGPSQIDMYDMKPDAPAEFRGEFKPIQTNVPGIDICEHLPLQAKIMDKLAIVRNMSFTGDHDYRLFMTGFPQLQPNQQPVALQRPDFGSVVSRLHDNGTGLPRYVSTMRGAHSSPAYLGPAHAAFQAGDAHPGLKNLGLHPSVSVDRLADRKELLRAFDTLRRDLDGVRNLAGIDALNAQALDIISSSKVRDAFDISKESKEVRSKYGPWGAFLQARRLVQAGVQVVTLSVTEGTGRWDTHSGNFKTLRELLPQLDHIVYALVTDLHEHGLDKDVLVVVGGEMGRTPRIGKQTSGSPPGADGRDHWKTSGFALMAGGGLRMGQAIGDTGPRGEGDSNKRYNLQNVYATLYHLFGIDPGATLTDQTGRPHFVLEERDKITELV